MDDTSDPMEFVERSCWWLGSESDLLLLLLVSLGVLDEDTFMMQMYFEYRLMCVPILWQLNYSDVFLFWYYTYVIYNYVVDVEVEVEVEVEVVVS